MSDDGDEYCVAHDQRITLCANPARCREIMAGWGLYREDPGHRGVHSCDGRCRKAAKEARLRAAGELAALTGEPGSYGEAPPGALDS